MGQRIGKGYVVQAALPFLNLPRHAIDELWKRFSLDCEGWGLSPAQFVHVCGALRESMGLPVELAEKYYHNFFEVLDTDKNNVVDALELLATVAAISGMDTIEKIHFVFDLYDFSESGALVRDEVTLLLKSTVTGLCKISGGLAPDLATFETLAKLVIATDVPENGGIPPNCDKKVRRSTFVTYFVTNPTTSSWIAHFDDLAAAKQTTKLGPKFVGVNLPSRSPECAHFKAHRRLPVIQDNINKDIVDEAAIYARLAPSEESGFPVARPTRPDARVVLDWVYGYGAPGVRQNLFYTRSSIVFHAGEVGVVFSAATEEAKATQDFMTAHSDLITSLAVSSDGRRCATGEIGDRPKIVVWDPENAAAAAAGSIAVFVGYHSRAVVGIAFSRDGTLLASLDAEEPAPKLAVHHVASGTRAFGTRLAAGSIIHDVTWSLQNRAFATVGNAHMKVWIDSVAPDEKATRHYQPKNGVLLASKDQDDDDNNNNNNKVQQPKTHTVIVAAGARHLTMVSGSTDGELFVWRGRNCTSAQLGAHDATPVTALHSPVDANGRAFLVLSAGTNMKARVWRLVADETELEIAVQIDLLEVGITGMACAVCLHASGERCLIGTTSAEVHEVYALTENDETPVGKAVSPTNNEAPLHCGPGASLSCVAGCAATNQFVAGAVDGSLTLWDAQARALSRRDTSLPSPVSCAAFSPDGSQLALGLEKGSVQIMNVRDFNLADAVDVGATAIVDVKWSKTIFGAACGSVIELYEPGGSWEKKATCACPATVDVFDLAAADGLVQASCGGELVGFSTETGEAAAPAEMRDAKWETMTCGVAYALKGLRSSLRLPLVPKCASNESVVACADTFGSLHVLNYPCLDASSMSTSLAGHAPGIAALDFVSPSVLVTAGADGAVFAWSVEPRDDEPEDDGVVEDEADDVEDEASSSSAVVPYDPASDATLVEDSVRFDDKSDLFKILRRGDKTEALLALEQANNIETATNERLPNDELVLEWIHGYASDQHSNVRYTSTTGEIVYPAACAGLVYDKTTASQRRNLEHTDEITALATCDDIVATVQRGAPPKLLVWNAVTMRVLAALRLADNSRAASVVAFSPCGIFLAVAAQDDQHTIFVFEWGAGGGRAVSETPSGVGKVLALALSPTQRMLVGTVDGFAVWAEATSRNPTYKKGLFGKTAPRQAVFAAAYVEGIGVVGTANGGVYRLDDDAQRTLASGAKHHKGPVATLWSCAPRSTDDEADLISGVALISGGVDGKIKLYSAELDVKVEIDLARPDKYCLVKASVSSACFNADRRKLLVGTGGAEILEISTADETDINGGPLVTGHCAGKLGALAAHPVLPEIATAGDDMTLRTWSIGGARKQLRMLKLDDVSRAIAYSPNGHLIAVGLGSDLVATPHAGTVLVVSTLKPHLDVSRSLSGKTTAPIVVIHFSPDGDVLAAATNDGMIILYDCLKKFQVKAVCTAHTERVVAFDFKSDSTCLRSCSVSSETLVFDSKNGELVRESPSDDDHDLWGSWTTTVGTPVAGALLPLASANDLATSHRSAELIATGDDFGAVKLFKWPCFAPAAAAKTAFGHASRVASVRFMPNGLALASIGLDDRCLFQWRVERNGTHASGAVVETDAPLQQHSGEQQQQRTPPADEVPDAVDNNFDDQAWRGELAAPSEDPGPQRPPPTSPVRLEHVYGVPRRVHTLAYNALSDVVYAVGRVVVASEASSNTQRFLESCQSLVAAVMVDEGYGIVAEAASPAVRIFDATTMAPIADMPVQLRPPIVLCALKGRHCAAIGVGPGGVQSLAVWTSRSGAWRDAEPLALTPVALRKVTFLAVVPSPLYDVVAGGLGETGCPSLLCLKLVGRNIVSRRVVVDEVPRGFTCGACVVDCVVTGDVAGTLELWGQSNSADNNEDIASLKKETTAHAGPVRAAVCAGGERCVTAGADGWVKVWTPRDLEVTHAFSLEAPIFAVAADGGFARLAAVTACALHEIVVDSGAKCLRATGHQENPRVVAAASNNLVASCGDDGKLMLWSERALVTSLDLGFASRAAAWTPDGDILAVGTGNGDPVTDDDGRVVVYKLLDNHQGLEVVVKVHNARGFVTVLKYSPDAKVLALGAHDNILYLYTVQSETDYKLYAAFDKHAAPIASVDFSTNSNYLRSCSSKNKSRHKLLHCTVLGGDEVAAYDVKDVTWASETCLIGYATQAVHQGGLSSDVSVLARSDDHKSLAACTTRGDLCFYGYPAVEPHDPTHVLAHAATVTSIDYAPGGGSMFTAGADTLILEWVPNSA
ncbi:hypothetical protein CTAYLR_001017 [Chrysophaeum taylorii]|uniref:EF-hand domain-containing protein n=1 Tax=Chrysophaeum taylorii TaxID=2483200 RepID=A0AAD7UH31_9STRA|nr:hypothetical protein CTAYLR_001017 [Chrysophaeum taylorii]